MNLLKTHDLTVGHGRPLISGINLEIGPGECILLCGANGSGKSTLMRTLAGVLPPLGGSFDGVPAVLIPTRIPKVGGFTLREFIRTSCYKESGWNGKLGDLAEKAIGQALDRLGLGPLTERDIATLSDGEFQKGCITTALVRLPAGDGGPGLILLDEPTAFLDVENRLQVLQTLRRITEGGKAALVFSSHDLADSTACATRILGIAPDGRLHDSRSEDKDALLRTCFPALDSR